MKTIIAVVLSTVVYLSAPSAQAQLEQSINHAVDKVFASYLVEEFVQELSEELPSIPKSAIKEAVVTAYTDAEDRESFFQYLESELRMLGVNIE